MKDQGIDGKMVHAEETSNYVRKHKLEATIAASKPMETSHKMMAESHDQQKQQLTDTTNTAYYLT